MVIHRRLPVGPEQQLMYLMAQIALEAQSVKTDS
jgi:hypothetical protein